MARVKKSIAVLLAILMIAWLGLSPGAGLAKQTAKESCPQIVSSDYSANSPLKKSLFSGF